jgi:hypothetical protein
MKQRTESRRSAAAVAVEAFIGGLLYTTFWEVVNVDKAGEDAGNIFLSFSTTFASASHLTENFCRRRHAYFFPISFQLSQNQTMRVQSRSSPS